MTILQEAKEKLRITWNEEDKRIERLIDSAMDDITRSCGGGRYKFNFKNAGLPKTLILEHVFYNWNNVLSEFWVNYDSEVLKLSLLTAVEMKKGGTNES